MNAPLTTETKTYVKCPFCGEHDFDLVGLKVHLLRWCEDFDKVEPPKEIRRG